MEGAEAAVDELRRVGLGRAHLGVAVGFLAGFALLGLAVAGIGPIGVGGLLALGAASGLEGSMLGGYLGVAAADQPLAVHEHLAAAALAPGEVLVAVCSHGHPETVRQILLRHGGTLRSSELT